MENYLINEMEIYLENMCAYLATDNKELFRYYAGKADAIRTILEERFNWDVCLANDHIKAMFDIMDENW